MSPLTHSLAGVTTQQHLRTPYFGGDVHALRWRWGGYHNLDFLGASVSWHIGGDASAPKTLTSTRRTITDWYSGACPDAYTTPGAAAIWQPIGRAVGLAI